MASNSENERLLNEILNETRREPAKKPAPAPESRTQSIKRQEPSKTAYMPKHAAPEAKPAPAERTAVHDVPKPVQRPETQTLDVPIAGEQRTREPQRPKMTEAERRRAAKKKKRRRRNKSAGRIYSVLIMLTIIIVVSVFLSVSIIAVGKDMIGVEGTTTLVPFTIPEGATTAEIAEDLYEAGIIEYPKAFVYFSRLSDADSGYIAGEHEVSSAMAYETIIDELTGVTVEERTTVDVMFPEGISVYEAAQKLEEANVCEAEKFLYYFNLANYGYEFEEHLPKTISKLKFCKMEGYLFPDTYTFYEEMEPADVCNKIYMNFNVKITDEYYERMDELGLTLDETITLASIVQAEAATSDVMKDVASVFWNRLNNPDQFLRLQSDPTGKYVEEIIKPNIDLADEKIYEAYDTYICTGLPAGAIGCPGKDAIEAVLYPNETSYFYFYANVDTGVTYFATTLEEHYANEEKIRQEQAEAAAAAEGSE